MTMETVKNVRVIPRLDVKAPNVVKGIHLEGLRVVGKPDELARKYYEDGADEILYMDIVASLYGRNNLLEIVEKASEEIFVPLTVGGGIRNLEDIQRLLRAGADKVAINTAATKSPSLITEAAKRFGSQCIVISIEAKAVGAGRWEAYTDNGREKTGLDAIAWAKQAEDLGAGEILVTSVDREGTKKGYDVELIQKISSLLHIPVIACGGAGTLEDVAQAALDGNADAVSVASLLHYGKTSVTGIKKFLLEKGIEVRSSC
jgi:cyclase